VFLAPLMAEFGASRSATAVLYSIASSAFYFLGPETDSAGDWLGPQAQSGLGALKEARRLRDCSRSPRRESRYS
jgi:hypothetical protein